MVCLFTVKVLSGYRRDAASVKGHGPVFFKDTGVTLVRFKSLAGFYGWGLVVLTPKRAPEGYCTCNCRAEGEVKRKTIPVF